MLAGRNLPHRMVLMFMKVEHPGESREVHVGRIIALRRVVAKKRGGGCTIISRLLGLVFLSLSPTFLLL